MAQKTSLLAQIHRNAVALISLVVAITSLGYNTWRNEASEANRNVRLAGFALMSELAELQQLTFLAHYDMDPSRGNPRIGWTHVLAVRDLSYPMPAEVREAAEDLYRVWQGNWERLDGEDGFGQIDAAVDRAKAEILGAIEALD